jgi:hypothetical protein
MAGLSAVKNSIWDFSEVLHQPLQRRLVGAKVDVLTLPGLETIESTTTLVRQLALPWCLPAVPSRYVSPRAHWSPVTRSAAADFAHDHGLVLSFAKRDGLNWVSGAGAATPRGVLELVRRDWTGEPHG